MTAISKRSGGEQNQRQQQIRLELLSYKERQLYHKGGLKYSSGRSLLTTVH